MFFLAYVAVLVFVYPRLADSRFDFGYTAALLAAMCISSFAQYYFGIANSLLLLADQRAYVNNAVQIVTLIANTAISAIMTWTGASPMKESPSARSGTALCSIWRLPS